MNEPNERYTAWNVYLHGRLIDTVFYDADCSREYVRDGLINHDGYDYRIKVYAQLNNQIPSPAV